MSALRAHPIGRGALRDARALTHAPLLVSGGRPSPTAGARDVVPSPGSPLTALSSSSSSSLSLSSSTSSLAAASVGGGDRPPKLTRAGVNHSARLPTRVRTDPKTLEGGGRYTAASTSVSSKKASILAYKRSLLAALEKGDRSLPIFDLLPPTATPRAPSPVVTSAAVATGASGAAPPVASAVAATVATTAAMATTTPPPPPPPPPSPTVAAPAPTTPTAAAAAPAAPLMTEAIVPMLAVGTPATAPDDQFPSASPAADCVRDMYGNSVPPHLEDDFLRWYEPYIMSAQVCRAGRLLARPRGVRERRAPARARQGRSDASRALLGLTQFDDEDDDDVDSDVDADGGGGFVVVERSGDAKRATGKPPPPPLSAAAARAAP